MSQALLAQYPREHKRVLLTSVFGPYAQDDEYGSRRVNPMELYHNQVTRTQGAFSLRMFHRSFGLMMVQANVDAACTLLDFPTLDGFVRELTQNSYDVVGISSIAPNVGKVEKMCELIRAHAPSATIVVGGHIANMPGIEERLAVDHVVRGDGVRWFRRFLGETEDAPVRHPLVYSGFGSRAAGITLPERPGDVAGILIPSVGCPVGCNFCSTSAMFGGKGKFVNFYETGDELFEVMREIEAGLHVQSFFVLDENFLLHRGRALRLLELMQQHHKSWSLYVFSSARVLRSYTMEQLVSLGISWVWMGLEGERSQYVKLSGVDTHGLVAELRSHGIHVLGSTIIGLEEHAPEHMDRVIDHAVRHAADFHQFMLYTPVPGTPLYEEHRAAGTLLTESECPTADAHGQQRFNFRHPTIRDGQEGELLLRAFDRDAAVNGPSLLRLVRTTLEGWKRYRAHPDRRIRRRWAREGKPLAAGYAALTWAARWRLRRDPGLRAQMSQLLDDICAARGWRARLAAILLGPLFALTLWREERRLARGWTYEPATIRETSACATTARGGLTVPAATPAATGVLPTRRRGARAA